MKYNIFSSIAPAMPKTSKGTEFCKLLLSQASKDMHDPPVSGLFPVLCAKNGIAKFLYHDLNWKVFCGQKGYKLRINQEFEIIFGGEHESHELHESFSLIHEKLNKYI